MTDAARAQGACSRLLGKQITVRGNVTYVEQLQIGNTKFDVIIAHTTDPACGTIQTTGKWRSCQIGMKFVGTGQLRSGPASRSAGNKKPGATDYGFEPISDEGLCR
ncbi:MAG TPA: hypothetical protein VNL39_06885 [Xanthobacteraceae bacterium]|nr:hypothetical protein [Xanthobacteraceae bacterium]